MLTILYISDNLQLLDLFLFMLFIITRFPDELQEEVFEKMHEGGVSLLSVKIR